MPSPNRIRRLYTAIDSPEELNDIIVNELRPTGWLKAGEQITLNGISPTRIDTWGSQGSITEDWSNGVPIGTKPQYIENAINGYPVVRFNGGNERLQSQSDVGDYLGNSNYTKYVVYKPTRVVTGNLSTPYSNNGVLYDVSNYVGQHIRGDQSLIPLKGSGSQSTDGAGQTWNSPGNIKANDDVYATSIVQSNSTQNLKATNFSIIIPDQAEITGIVVEVRRKASNASSARDLTVQLLKNGIATGENKAIATAYGTSEGAVVYGLSNDLWNTTWTPEDLRNSNFGVVFQAEEYAGLSTTVSVDSIFIQVYYNLAHEHIFYQWDGNADSVTRKVGLSNLLISEQLHNGTNLKGTLFGSGEVTTASGNIQVTTGVLRLGGIGSPNNFYGDIVEVLIFDRTLNSTERDIVESYLQAKFGKNLQSQPIDLVGIPGAFKNSNQWTITAGWSITGDVATFNAANTNPLTFTGMTVEAGETYFCQFSIKRKSAGVGMSFAIGGVLEFTASSVGIHKFVVISQGTDDPYFRNFSGAGNMDIDDLIIQKALFTGQLHPNGDFSDGLTGWSGTGGISVVDGQLVQVGAFDTLTDTSVDIVVGEIYRVTYTIIENNGTVFPQLGGIPGVSQMGTTGTFTETFKAGNTNKLSFLFLGGITIDDVIIERCTNG